MNPLTTAGLAALIYIKLCHLVLFGWIFLTTSTNMGYGYSIATVGPFETLEKCEAAKEITKKDMSWVGPRLEL